MSGSDWHKFAKVVGLASAAFLVLSLVFFTAFSIGVHSGYYEGQQERATGQYASDTQRIVDDCFRLPSRTQTSECVSEAYEASHENKRAEKDLTAQRNMADWAWWVVILGFLQFFATIVTLGFVKLTLDATLEAVKDTGKATRAMERQVEMMAEAERPWVKLIVEKFEFRLPITKGAVHGFDIQVRGENFGGEPAKLIAFDADFRPYRLPESPVVNLKRVAIESRVIKNPGVTIYPGEIRNIHLPGFSLWGGAEEAVSDYLSGKSRSSFALIVTLSYRGVISGTTFYVSKRIDLDADVRKAPTTLILHKEWGDEHGKIEENLKQGAHS